MKDGSDVFGRDLLFVLFLIWFILGVMRVWGVSRFCSLMVFCLSFFKVVVSIWSIGIFCFGVKGGLYRCNVVLRVVRDNLLICMVFKRGLVLRWVISFFCFVMILYWGFFKSLLFEKVIRWVFFVIFCLIVGLLLILYFERLSNVLLFKFLIRMMWCLWVSEVKFCSVGFVVNLMIL